jgi:hypothetical protein
MTSQSDMDHPDVSQLSDLTEGLLPRLRAAEVRRHLDACTLCADTHRSIIEIRGLLGALPAPAMPADVAERIDTVLAAEVPLASDAPVPVTGAPTRGDNTFAISSTERLGSMREVRDDDTTAEPPVLLSRGSTGSTEGRGAPRETTHVSRETSRGNRGPGGHSRAGTGPRRLSTMWHRRRTTILGGVAAAAVIGVSALVVQSVGGTSDRSSIAARSATSASPHASASATREFSHAQLQPTVDSLLASVPTAPSGTQPDLRSSTTAATGADSPGGPLVQDAVPYCVRQGTGRTDPVLAAEAGTYRGAPAYLLVLADPTDATRVRVYVIAADCMASGPTAKGEVLRTESYPRG